MADFKIDPDYKEVAERLRDLFAKHPDARMRGSYEIVDVAGKLHVVYRAECHRDADDQTPAVGYAWEEIPGRTPYTKGSELQNAETSAWGRAIVAVGASESKRIASADEMRTARARQSVPDAPLVRHTPATPERIDRIRSQVVEFGLGDWVKDQHFAWPWSDESCAKIGARIADEIATVDAAGPAPGVGVPSGSGVYAKPTADPTAVGPSKPPEQSDGTPTPELALRPSTAPMTGRSGPIHELDLTGEPNRVCFITSVREVDGMPVPSTKRVEYRGDGPLADNLPVSASGLTGIVRDDWDLASEPF